MEAVVGWLWPLVAGGVLYWMGGRSRGRNARAAFYYWAWGFWLIFLMFRLVPVPVFWPLSLIIRLTPSVICFVLGANAVAREMRAQQQGEFTDPA